MNKLTNRLAPRKQRQTLRLLARELDVSYPVLWGWMKAGHLPAPTEGDGPQKYYTAEAYALLKKAVTKCIR